MRRPLAGLTIALIAVGVAAATVDAHDLFLRPRDFVVRSGSQLAVRVLNGSFTSSEAMVARARLRDLTLVGPAGMAHPDRSTWSDGEKESEWQVRLGGPGTYVLGASLEPKTIHLTGAQFNDYLREEGLSEVLAIRRSGRQLNDASHERYAKHVKALVRVTGSATTSAPRVDTAYRAVLDYPAELIPLDDPYTLRVGGHFRVRALVDGQPAPNQVVLAGGRTISGQQMVERQLRTDKVGVATIGTVTRGTWYVKFIHMRRIAASAADSVNYESKWATLTFARP